MFQKNKYIKSSQSSLNHKSNNGVSLQSSKYHPNIYSKKKSTLNKKINNNKFAQNHTWKKQNSYNNWNKENDKNYLNYEQYNKNDNNKYYYIYKEKKENKSYYSNKCYIKGFLIIIIWCMKKISKEGWYNHCIWGIIYYDYYFSF